MTANPLKWHGGKSYLAKWIIAHHPAKDSFKHYVVTHGGGMATEFEMNLSDLSVVVNDIYGALTNFWNVLRSDSLFDHFQRIAKATPFSEELFRELQDREILQVMDNATEAELREDAVRWAWAFFIRYRQSRQGIGKHFATTSRSRTRAGMNEQVSSWLSAVDGLPEAHKVLRTILIRNADAAKVIKEEDSPHTFFYLDPPYLHEERTATDAYVHEMTAEQHEALLEQLSRIEGKFLLSGYPSRMYSNWAEAFGWRLATKQIDNKASSARTKAVKTECLWANYDFTIKG